ncbi:hypothetical protein G6031_02800 [Dietzia sp. CQ4]|uniref:hypothetical protein n=1 Tax=Dietzia sp. (strain CQ4) TaxID=370437 RepID=UPI0015FBD29E|nr:hypothetical protein [Dietzia sp. CQ4]MBB1033317.1 hypothetical protein [Dietzia sp. CQ4]
MSIVTTLASPDTFVLADGLLGTINVKSEEAKETVRIVSGLVAIAFVVFQAAVSRMAMGRIIVSSLAAGVFLWVVFNVTEVKDKVGEDLALSVVESVAVAPSTPVLPV